MTSIDRRDTRDRAPWIAHVALGVVLVALAALGFGARFFVGLATVKIYGAILIAAGVMHLGLGAVSMVRERSASPFVAGILSLLVGLFLVTRPVTALGAFSLMLGLTFVTIGLLKGFISGFERPPGWQLDLVYAVIAIALGSFLILIWPESSAWLLGALVSAELAVRGLASLGDGFAMAMERRGEKGSRPFPHDVRRGGAAPA